MKKLIILLSLFLLMFAFASCANNNNTNNENNNDDNENQVENNNNINNDNNENNDIDNENNFDTTKIDNEVTEANVKFGLDIFKKINEEEMGKNVFISPISISSALTMTYNGSDGSTKNEMSDVLEYRDIESNVVNESYKNIISYLNSFQKEIDLNISNSIWIREGEEIGEDFISDNQEFFDAKVKSIDFLKADAADRINQWILDATEEKIEKMIEPPISSDVVMYLINAIYFKGTWSEQFDKDMTFESTFNTEDGKERKVDMMHKKSTVDYSNEEDYKVLRLSYGEDEVSMYLVLPKESRNINDLISDLSYEKWIDIKSSVEETKEVDVYIPKFKLEYGIKELNDSLKSLGMKEAFSQNADFSKIRDGIFISRVLHKAVIEVNEEGSEAAAATVVEMKETAIKDPLIFRADRSFVFFITDNETDTILFAGKVEDIE